MATGLDAEFHAFVDLGSNPRIPSRDLGQCNQRVEHTDRASRRSDRVAPAEDLLAELIEEFPLEPGGALARAQYLRFDFAQGGGGEPLGVGKRLAPLVVVRDTLELRLAHLERVAVNGMEANFEGPDARAFTLLHLEPGDPLAALVGALAQRVEIRPIALADVPGLERPRVNREEAGAGRRQARPR